MRTFLKVIKYVGLALLLLVVLASIVPYFFTLNSRELQPHEKPFADSRFAVIGGVRLHYRLNLPAAQPRAVVLMVHGLAGNTFSWRHNVDTLTQNGFAVLRVDLPAFGYSDRYRPALHGPAFRAQLLWQLLDTLTHAQPQLAAPIVVAGHSMGSGVVLAMAALQPKRTHMVMLVDGAMMGRFRSSFGGPAWLQAIMDYPPAFRLAQVLAERQYFNPASFTKLLGSAYGQTADTAAVNGYLRPMLLKHTAGAVLRSFLHNADTVQLKYENVTMPVRMVWGGHDTWVAKASAERALKLLPNAQLHVINVAGHCPMETHPQAFNAWMLQHLQQPASAPGAAPASAKLSSR
jgi:pimeloyl-ACP methyl ester carboxylesterase